MQSAEACVLCSGKIDQAPWLSPYYSDTCAHIQCIASKSCVFCSVSSLCIRCQHRDCQRSFHQHCFQRYFTQSLDDAGFYCEFHRRHKNKRKEYQRLWLARGVANRVGQLPEIVQKIKESQSESKVNSICSGQVFWFCIGSQYFPNFVNLCLPEIPVNAPIEPEDWSGSIDENIDRISGLLAITRDSNAEIVRNCSASCSISLESSKDYKEEELILCEIRDLKLRQGLEDYLNYFESKGQEETEANGNAEKRISSLREVPRNEEDFLCSICGDGDYEDDDLIVICSNCEMGVHMKCYGIPVVPEHDWICHGCLHFPDSQTRASLRCALCPMKGGCLKPTKHTTATLSFPNYPEGSNETVWCHMFCAFHIESNIFGNEEFLDDINLLNVDPKRYALKCQVCNTKDGACLQCQYGRCQAAFHPECGKDYFTNTRDKTGYDEVSYFCPLHKPMKLRRQLDGKEKKCLEDIFSFCKAFERWEKRGKNFHVPSKTSNVEKPFTREEKCKLIRVIDSEMEKLVHKKDSEFTLVIKKSNGSLRHKLQVNRPAGYNILDPSAILQKRIFIKGRKVAECYKFYNESLFPMLKKELEILKVNTVIYSPHVKKVKKISYQTLKEKFKKKFEEPKPEVKVNYVQSTLVIPVLQDLLTNEVYCICRQPFVEQSFKKPLESDRDFEVRTLESQMIQCDKCEEWYHYKCIGLLIGMEVPQEYICKSCEDSAINNSHIESNIDN